MAADLQTTTAHATRHDRGEQPMVKLSALGAALLAIAIVPGHGRPLQDHGADRVTVYASYTPSVQGSAAVLSGPVQVAREDVLKLKCTHAYIGNRTTADDVCSVKLGRIPGGFYYTYGSTFGYPAA